MKEQKLKDNIKKIAIKFGLIALGLIAVLLALWFFNQSFEEKYRKTSNRVSGLEGELAKKNRSYSAAEGSLESFLSITKDKLPAEIAYDKSYQRIKAVMPAVEKLKDAYYFKKLSYTLGKVEENKDYSKRGVKAYSSDISLSFEGVSDQFVFSFMNDLERILPGYFKLKNFEISKKQDLTNSTVKTFLVSKGFHFVAGKIDFEWITFKSEGEK